MKNTHLLVGLLSQLEFHKEQTIIEGRIVKIIDGKIIGVLLIDSRVFVR